MQKSLPSLLFFGIFLISAGAKPAQEPLCVLAPNAMPASWRPQGNVQRGLSSTAWSSAESADAAKAARIGLDELREFFLKRPDAVVKLDGDAVESVLDVSYGAGIMPELQTAAKDEARKVLEQLMQRELARDPGTVRCNEFSRLLWLAIYSNALRPEAIDETKKIAASANAAFRACGSFDAVLGHDYRRILSDKNPSMDDLWDLVISSIQFTDAQLVPSVELSTEAKGLPESVWRYFARYPLRGASAYAGGASNTDFYYTAYLATHVAYIPTGYGRHPIYVSDSPRLYRFLRENFYAVLEMGELDLVAEFVDLFRQYGCTESNDLQLRDGTRYLLRLFHASGDHWMAYREPDEPRNIDDYSMIHKPWTGIGGVRARVPEPVLPGTYGSIIRKWLKPDR